MRGKEIKTLSRRELQVLKLMSLGFDNQEIAGELFICEKTVKNHISNMYKKMNFHGSCRKAIHYYWTEVAGKMNIPIY